MANKTLLVAQREYLENIRTKTFWIGIAIVPLLIGLSIGIGALLKKFKEVQRYAVVDLGSGDLVQRTEREFRNEDVQAIWRSLTEAMQSPEAQGDLKPLVERLGPMEAGKEPTAQQTLILLDWLQKRAPEQLAKVQGIEVGKKFAYASAAELGVADLAPDERRQALNKMVGDGRLFAYFVLGANPVESLEDFRYVSNNLTDDSLRGAYQRAVTSLVQKDRIAAAGIGEDVARHIQQRVSFKEEKVGASGEAEDVNVEDKATGWAPVGFVYLLWIAIFSIANLLLTNTIEEKSNRIIEVLLSSVSPAQLMHGKIFGIAFTGMTIVGTWVLFAILTAQIAPALLGEGGGALQFLVAAIGNSDYLIAFVLYFLAGYLLYAAMLVAIGSVCNTLKEAQNLMQPVMMILMVPLVSMVFVTQEPNGNVAKVLSFIPLFTPFTMMNRAGGPPETWEYVATTALLLVTIWLAFKAAGKVFRVGVLMTGNPPKLKEILGWLKES